MTTNSREPDQAARRRNGLRAGALAAVGLMCLAWLLSAAPASGAQASEWEILSFDAAITIAEDGSLRITETIEVDFHVPSRGIYREIPFRIPADDDNVRRYRFDQLTVQTSAGAPDDLHQEQSGDYLVWRIGDPDIRVTGEHTYVISYRARGALNRFDSHDELFWNVTGNRWEVPIQRTSATVQAPAISDVRCFAGATGQTDPCAEASHDERTATFTADVLPPRTQLDVVVAMPPGVVDVAPPDLQPSNPVLRLFQVDPLRAGGGVLVGLLGMVGVVALARRGRDERAEVSPAALPGGVEYRPPDGLRPAQLRTLLTQRVDNVSLSATLVDLAVRGHLTIEEVGSGGRFGRQDWSIYRRQAADDGLQPYEREMLQGLFTNRKTARTSVAQLGQRLAGDPSGPPAPHTQVVTVSALRDGSFRPYYHRITKMLYGDVVQRGFFKHGPNQIRGAFATLGVVLLVASIAGIVAMANSDMTYGLVLAPVPVVALLLLLFSQWAPRRTAQGSAMNQRARGFREFVRTAEADRMAFAEREQIFTGYLPYAMAFGCVDRWVKEFERIGVPAETATRGWYVGQRPMDIAGVTSSMSSLASQVGGSMSKTASSSGSSGFSSGGSSGGGGGGGGGGRW